MENLQYEIQHLLRDMEANIGKLEGSNTDQSQAIENDIHMKSDQISMKLDRLEMLVNKEHFSRRQIYRMKSEQLRHEYKHVQALHRNFQNRRHIRDKQKQERELLLHTTFRTNDEEALAINMDDADVMHNEALRNANHGLDNIIGQGYQALENLRNQRSVLKGTKTKMLNIVNHLGLSNTTIRLTAQRIKQDKYVLYGLMIASTVIMWLLWKYFA